MSSLRFQQHLKALDLLAPVAVLEAATASRYIKVDQANWATFMVTMGAAATTSATDVITLTVECSTSGTSNASEVALPFKYRIGSKVGTDSMGEITDADTAGVAVSMDDVTGGSSALTFIDVDPAVIPAYLSGGSYLRVVATPSGSSDASIIIGVVGFLEPFYPGDNIPSAT